MMNFTVSLPTDEGYIGRECNNAKCGRYFRVHSDDLKDHICCPYCGEEGGKGDFLTADQWQHAKNVAKEKATKYAHDQLNQMLQRTFGGSRGNSLVKFTVRTSLYRERTIRPRYRERKVDSQLLLVTSAARFQVDGIFGFCPHCKGEHIRIYDVDLAIIRQEVDRAPDTQRALRHAYGDLVSTFELICKRRALKITSEPGRFQNLVETRRFFVEQCGKDVIDDLTDSEWLDLRHVFQKRHLYTHGTEFIDERYVAVVPEDRDLLGKEPTLSMCEFEQAARVVRKIIDLIVLLTKPKREKPRSPYERA